MPIEFTDIRPFHEIAAMKKPALHNFISTMLRDDHMWAIAFGETSGSIVRTAVRKELSPPTPAPDSAFHPEIMAAFALGRIPASLTRSLLGSKKTAERLGKVMARDHRMWTYDKAADVAIAKETTDDERYFATVTDLDFDRATDERVFVLA